MRVLEERVVIVTGAGVGLGAPTGPPMARPAERRWSGDRLDLR